MAECKKCQKALNREASEIGSWCIDCIKDMSDKNTSSMETERDYTKKEKRLILIFSAIGAVGGIIFGIALGVSDGDALAAILSILVGIWMFGGLGAGLGFFISRFVSSFKNARARGESFGGALKGVLLLGVFFLVFGFFLGVIFFLFLILRRNSWIKKFDTIIDSENAAIAELEGYTLGKDVNKSDLSRKVNIIADNFELTNNWDWRDYIKWLKKLKIVQ